MHRWISWRLYARLISLQRAAYLRIATQRHTAETSASPTLVYATIVISLILAILEIDLHRQELRVLGLIGSEEGVGSSLAGL
jgi:hypothetical protein